jgi:phosphonate transport system permease protein
MRWRDFSFRRYQKWLLPAAVLSILVIGAAMICGVNFGGLFKGIASGISFLQGMFPPDWGAFPELVKPAFDSIVLALLGTFWGTLISLVFGLAAASNIAPRWLRLISRSLISIERSIPELIILLMLVAVMGLGPFAGILALTIGCVGMLGKLFADAIEEIDQGSIESIEALGAGKLQVIHYGVIEQILPSIISFALFRFELNIRLSIILGAVGAGGIGYELYRSFSILDYARACSAIIMTLILVFATSRLSTFLRRKIDVGGALR